MSGWRRWSAGLVGGAGWWRWLAALIRGAGSWRWFAAAVGLLLVGGLASCRLADVPPAWYDEGINLQAARNLALDGQYGLRYGDRVSLFDLQLTTGPTVLGPVALSFDLLGVGLWQARLVMLGYTLLAAAGLFVAAKAVYGPVAGVVAVAALCASEQAGPASTRDVVGEAAALAYLFWGVVLLAQARRRAGTRWLVGAGVLFGLAVLTKGEFGLLVPALVAGLLLSGGVPLKGREPQEHGEPREHSVLLEGRVLLEGGELLSGGELPEGGVLRASGELLERGVARRRWVLPGGGVLRGAGVRCWQLVALLVALGVPVLLWQVGQLALLGPAGYVQHVHEQSAAVAVSAGVPAFSQTAAAVQYLAGAPLTLLGLAGLGYAAVQLAWPRGARSQCRVRCGAPRLNAASAAALRLVTPLLNAAAAAGVKPPPPLIKPLLRSSGEGVIEITPPLPETGSEGAGGVWVDRAKRPRRSSHGAPEELVLVVFAGCWVVWYVGFSAGYGRYVVPLAAVCCVFVGRLGRDLVRRGGLSVGVAALLGVVLAAGVARHVGVLLQPPEHAAERMAAVITQDVPPGQVTESLEWELDVLTPRRFHHPPPFVPAVPYRVPAEVAYLVDGPSSKATRLYASELASGSYQLLASVGSYDLYQSQLDPGRGT